MEQYAFASSKQQSLSWAADLHQSFDITKSVTASVIMGFAPGEHPAGDVRPALLSVIDSLIENVGCGNAAASSCTATGSAVHLLQSQVL